MYLPRDGRSGRGSLLDFNLLPPAHRPRPLPLLSIALGLLAAVGLLLLIAIFQFKSTADAEVTSLRGDLQDTQRHASELGQAAPLGEGRQLAVALGSYRVGWSRVMQGIVASAPADVRVQDVGFTVDPAIGPQAVVKGEAAEYAAVVEYADNLRSSPLFSRVTIQSMGQAAPITATATATVVPSGSSAGLLPPSGLPAQTGTVVPPTPQLVLPSATRTPSVPRSLIPTTSATAGTSTPTATVGTRTPTATATPTSNPYDFAVVGKAQSCDMSAPANAGGDLVYGRVLDIDGIGLPNVRVRVTSIHTDTPWSTETGTDSEGAFHFALTKANWQVEVVTGSSEVASDLWTRSAQETGVCRWEVTFKKTNPGTPVVGPSWTPTITATPTNTGTATPPVPVGTVITSGVAYALLNSTDASLVNDGNTDSIWNSSATPNIYTFWEETFDTTYNVNGIVLVVSQSPEGNTTHVVRFYNASDGEISSVTISGYTSDGQTINRPFGTPIVGVKRLRVETTVSPSFVAWREIRVYAGAAATPTASPTPTPRVWQGAQPINVNEANQTRTFYLPPNDVDWAVFRTDLGITTTHTMRVIGSDGTDPELYLYEGAGDSSFVAYSDSGMGCGTDPLIERALKPDTTYYLKIKNLTASSIANYQLWVRTGLLGCVADLGAPSPEQSVADLLPNVPLAQSAVGAWPPSGRGPGVAAPVTEGRAVPARETTPVPSRQAVSFLIVVDVKPEKSQ